MVLVSLGHGDENKKLVKQRLEERCKILSQFTWRLCPVLQKPREGAEYVEYLLFGRGPDCPGSGDLHWAGVAPAFPPTSQRVLPSTAREGGNPKSKQVNSPWVRGVRK
jgi:hypothetical protein